jgi:hypothetical protein
MYSALCLRIFGEDFTPFGKEMQVKKQAGNSRAEQVGTLAVQDEAAPSGSATMNEQKASDMGTMDFESEGDVGESARAQGKQAVVN